jgi:hypothetical protein
MVELGLIRSDAPPVQAPSVSSKKLFIYFCITEFMFPEIFSSPSFIIKYDKDKGNKSAERAETGPRDPLGPAKVRAPERVPLRSHQIAPRCAAERDAREEYSGPPIYKYNG